MENTSELWQAEVNGQIYEASFEELAQWIQEGALLPQDKVRRGNLRWIEAQKVPTCLLYTSDAADERSSVDLGGRRIIKKQQKQKKKRRTKKKKRKTAKI